MALKKEDALEARILQDQLADLRAGLFVSMPISTILSGLILTVQALSDGGFAAAVWFLVVIAINAARLGLARYQLKETGRQDDLTEISQRLRWFGILALLAGFAWSFLAVLTVGYTTPQAPLHLIILAGISAGAVTYGSSYAAAATNFITPPLLITVGCLSANGNFEGYILAFAVLLFMGGLVRSSSVGQARFREASRLRHEAERLAAEMERNSREDHLTGLLNRRGLEYAIDQLENTDGPFVAMLIDLDGFKSVNDTYGHRTGDELLAMIARRIEEEAPEGSTLARIGGDEFVLFFPSLRDSLSPSNLASNIIAKIASPYPKVASVRIGASIGIYLAERPGLTEMLRRADVALYTAKRRGRNEFCVFDAELDRELQRRQSIERDLHSAIETRSLGPWFQPIVRLDTEAVVGFEALLRWSHPIHGAISPPEIMTAARETGMLQLLTQTVFADCCALIDGLMKADCRNIRVAMNVSPRELEAGDIDDMILNGLAAKGLPATMFEIEITEESPVDPDRVDEKLGRLSHAGISIALDDFGTGFSTLASLKDSRIGKVKIDQGFVRGLAKSREDRLLVKSVIDLGRTLGIEVMAEGVETEADRQALRKLGCRTAQGFLFSKAVPLSQALDLAVKEHAKEL
ncbi:putative bifunctional diguanylate cyclase/phosphodiesterase [Allomesorhizobium camelthorni]|uniref:EAL domain-containing protein n=1 Tax=Allomesorhizobium camelthorni TaxID=475069 RepID=A0A6G4WH68_9HYPH|nr:EAL domain-containing protein [Mesorhizobium camelthorni]NGO53470.1 EAL domain-containing protein [Mesorhizobium camelthorni]